jgi:polyketide biosynthesis enoyl-CoA hydratase PksI
VSEQVVQVQETGEGTVQITMRDLRHRNAFSPGLTAGLIEAFATMGQLTRYRAVVLTGANGYFATGGTQEGLLALQEGRGRFIDAGLYRLALDCPIPVIAAMQGHAIGGGLVFGLFADFIVLSRESIYSANFMKYGFTPGMGATWIVPRKLGHALGTEMLIAAGNYRGAELERRGIGLPVLPLPQVGEYAHELAVRVAQKPRDALITLKAHLVEQTKLELPRIVEQELAMHEKTFPRAEVRQRIRALFNN